MEFILNILSTPSILVGLMAMLGLILQGKKVEDVVKGTIKTIVGFLVLSAGAAFLQSGSLNAFGELFNYAFNMQGVVPNNEAIVSLGLEKFASQTAYIMCVGMVANIVMARFSRMNYIFLTGHHTLYMACMLAVILNVGGLDGAELVISGGLALGLIMVISPAICQPTMRKIVKTDDLAFGHFGGFGYWFAAQIGKLFKGSKSTEEVNFPQRVSFLRDTTVAIGLTMVIFFMVVTAVAVGKGLLTDSVMSESANLAPLFSGDTKTHWAVWAFTSGLSFAGGVYIILAGVRLIIGEIVPAFKGIAEKLVPNAKPALDCPVVFPYAPNAVLIGFLVSFVGGIVGLFVLGFINSSIMPVALILPGVIPHFFCGATAGVFANAEGGLKGCLAGSFLHGLLITFLPAICMPVMGALNFANSTFSDADFSLAGIFFGNIAQYVQGFGLMGVCIVLFLLPIIYNFIAPKKQKAE
ncbi:PTS system ascorbate-specific IIC component [Breznakia sp. PF5-3]|uniref:PTS ascorbate transporter subunit IIC n=1 Tax=unclassified Breznakia TaxID=2623764 RepID=UPI0024049B9E|nr:MULTISPECIES: PTS ascorbate transporter subunit IIC [unclassified Breznakia]MDF9823835.1 PTS system ascorbate-specific IIC component [Breznakia sp. PM6-1]MDF9834599.1 PTS system ascorbate-specific IIC component [Breznakia sp. PF5-3]MDF9836784.1 PTS system ascorbate-specific IIC component [Breznakia sp. PFB2-8]MDF9858767.1 PTS system ascorbate-specific IIC component [Breznakia sp. PH5-24]